MSHRLFNSLVVSSSLLLQGGVSGCASTTESASEATASEGTAPRADTSTSGSESSSNATNADVPTDTAPAAPTAATTLASCEGGWHTTKAGPRCEVDTSGVTVCCPSYAMVTPENRASICCVQQGAQPVGSGE
jgi:hypothetical protein